MSGVDIDDELVALSIVAPDSFTAARNARAKELRAAKDKERAAAVAKLTKPTWTSWALNVLAREHPDEIEAWLAAGDALDDALAKALDGDRDELRSAQRGERAALAHAAERAADEITRVGRRADDQVQQRLTAALRAAVTDGAVRDRLVRGTLAEDIEAPSFGFGFGAPDDTEENHGRVARSDDDTVVSMASARQAKAVKARTAKGRGRATDHGGSDDVTAEERAAAAERSAREEADARAAEEERIAAAERAAERTRLEEEVVRCQAEVDRLEAQREQLREVADAAETAARDAADAADTAQRTLAEARAELADRAADGT